MLSPVAEDRVCSLYSHRKKKGHQQPQPTPQEADVQRSGQLQTIVDVGPCIAMSIPAAAHQNRHGMCVWFEALVETDEMFMHHCFIRQLFLKLHGAFNGGKFTILQQVRHFCKAALFGELFNWISTIE
mmetsp:Transcript_6027/g.37368  ORF Transcript_6027/g.37368 Transcript_6027/m.37368 type:complete len:128 (+) Transcript_6027:1379-1762(+)